VAVENPADPVAGPESAMRGVRLDEGDRVRLMRQQSRVLRVLRHDAIPLRIRRTPRADALYAERFTLAISIGGPACQGVQFGSAGTAAPLVHCWKITKSSASTSASGSSRALTQAGLVCAVPDNSNVAGVTGGMATADQAAAAAVTTGLELAIALVDLNYVGGPIRVMVGINNTGHDFWSNQFLGGLIPSKGNLGSDGNGNFNGTDAVNLLDLQEIKNQLFHGVTAVNFLLDVNAEGAINLLDLQATKSNLFIAKPGCIQ
jgi:hypothetical protein